MTLLAISKLSATVDGKQILDKLNLTVSESEIHALMGPNGSGKSTLANILMGNKAYGVQRSADTKLQFEGVDILDMPVDERARAGIFLAWQNPMTIPGLNVFTLCKTACEVRGVKINSVTEFKNTLEEMMKRLGLSKEYLGRGVNEGFSGGEKKRLELLQLLLLTPKLAILDEIDSGLDIDALKLVGSVVKEMQTKGTAFILITHYKRLLDYVKPDFVHVLKEGKISRSGGHEIVEELESKGYAN